MTNVFAASLNEAGIAHVAEELKRLGLDWDVSAVCSAIYENTGFMNMESGDSYEHEISNIKSGNSSYGAFGWINIESEHVSWELLEN